MLKEHGLTRMPEGIELLTHLESLDLSSNGLVSFRLGCRALSSSHLHVMHAARLADMGIPHGISDKLSTRTCWSCGVQDKLPVVQLCRMSTLTSLACDGNPRLVSPPPEVSSQGATATLEYLRRAVESGQVRFASLDRPKSRPDTTRINKPLASRFLSVMLYIFRICRS